LTLKEMQEVEAIMSQIRLLEIQRNQLISDIAEEHGVSVEGWSFRPATYEFIQSQGAAMGGQGGVPRQSQSKAVREDGEQNRTGAET
jgi:hypothetical protein